MVLQKGLSPDTLRRILDIHEDLTRPVRTVAHAEPHTLSPYILKVSRKALVTKIVLGESTPASFCVKEERNNPERPSPFYWFKPSRNRKAWKNSLLLLSHGILTPCCFALFEERWYGLCHRSFLVQEYIEDALPLNAYAKRLFGAYGPGCGNFSEKRAFLGHVAGFVRGLHERGIYHSDMKADNILIRKKGEGLEFLLIDLDRVAFSNSVSLLHRVKNLAQLYLSAGNFITASDRMRFFRDYSIPGRWDRRRRKAILLRILRICEKQNRRRAKAHPVLNSAHGGRD